MMNWWSCNSCCRDVDGTYPTGACCELYRMSAHIPKSSRTTQRCRAGVNPEPVSAQEIAEEHPTVARKTATAQAGGLSKPEPLSVTVACKTAAAQAAEADRSRASRSRTREHSNLLTSTPDEAALAIACAVLTAKDLVCLRLTCRRFGIKCIVIGGASQRRRKVSLVEEAARRWVAGCSEQERGWVSHRLGESWLSLMHEVEVLRLPLAFGWTHASITLSEDGAVATKNVQDWCRRTAPSKVVMRSGRHFAQITTVQPHQQVYFGVVRPDVEGGQPLENFCHFYSTYTGKHYINTRRHEEGSDWEGAQTAKEQGDRVGMLLDLDQGSVTVYKNDDRMGVMVAEGLSGPLCWAVSLHNYGTIARIDSAALPEH